MSRPTYVDIDTIGVDSGAVTVRIDVGRTELLMRTPRGSFAVVTDSAHFAAWADSAGESPTGGDWIRTEPRGTSRPVAPEAIRLIPVAADSGGGGRPSADYVLYGTNGAWDGALELRPTTAARLLAALQAHHTGPPADRSSSAVVDVLEVDEPAYAAPGNRPPVYPSSMRESGMSGEALMMFVVDTTGRVDMRSVRALRYSRPEFARAARAALPSYRFVAARMHGRRVAQIVQLPFEFRVE